MTQPSALAGGDPIRTRRARSGPGQQRRWRLFHGATPESLQIETAPAGTAPINTAPAGTTGAAGPDASTGAADQTASLSRLDWLIAAAIGLAAAAISLPFRDTIRSLNDEGVLANGAELLLRGGRLYRDVFEIIPPGGFLLTETWFGLFGVSLASLRALAIVIFAATAGLIWLTCRLASGARALTAALIVGWLIMSWGLWPQQNHHWIATLGGMLALAASLSAASSRSHVTVWAGLAGLAAGATGMVTQHAGAAVALAGLVPWLNLRRDHRRALAYVAGCAALPCALALRAATDGTLAAAIQQLILAPLRHYAGAEAVAFGSFATPQNAPLTWLFPLAGLLTAWAAAVQGRQWLAAPATRVSIAFCCAGFVTCLPRPDAAHIAFVAPLAMALVARSAAAIGTGRAWRSAALSVTMLACVIPSACLVLLVGETIAVTPAATPRGTARFVTSLGAEPLVRHLAGLPEGARVFYYPFDPMLAFLSGHRHAAPFEVFTPGYTPAWQYRAACVSAISGAAWVVIDRAAAAAETIRTWMPAVTDPHPPETAAFERILETAFAPEAQYGVLELRRPAAGIDAAVCDTIGGRDAPR